MAAQNIDSYFEDLYEKTYKKVLAYIIAKCGDTEDISDIFQETYLEIVKIIRRHGSEYIKSPEAFVINVAKKKVYRHYKLTERLKNNKSIDDFDDDNLQIPDKETVEVDECVFDKMMVDEAHKIILGKDLLTRKIFYLFYYMDMPIKEVAEILSISESNVKNRIYRTLKEIRSVFIRSNGAE